MFVKLNVYLLLVYLTIVAKHQTDNRAKIVVRLIKLLQLETILFMNVNCYLKFI